MQTVFKPIRSLVLLGAGLVVGALFIRILHYSYIELDDPKHIFENPLVLQADLGALWRHGYFGLYIPVTYSLWSFVVNVGSKWGGVTELLHGLSLVLHLSVCFAVYCLLKELFFREWKDAAAAARWAFVAAFVFAVHPLQVESVSWISASRDLLSALFVVVSIILLQRERAKWASLVFAMALLSKPSAVFAVGWAWVLGLGGRGRPGILILWTALALGSMGATIFLQDTPAGAGRILYLRPVVAMDSFGFYLLHFLFPDPLLIDYSRSPLRVLAGGFSTWINVLTASLALALLAWTRLPRLFRMGLALFFISLLPTSGIIPFSFQKFSTVSDHYVYPALVGAVMTMVSVLHQLSAKRQRIQNAFLFALFAALFVRSSFQIEHWRDSETLFNSVLTRNPQSLIAQTNLAYVLGERQRFSESIRHLRKAIEIAPDEIGLRMSLISMEGALGYRREALRDLVAARVADPHNREIAQKLAEWTRKP